MVPDPGRADAALTSLRELVRHVGHDLNNHLASIIVNLSLAMAPDAADPDRRAQTREALDAARHAAQLARQLFAVGRELPLDDTHETDATPAPAVTTTDDDAHATITATTTTTNTNTQTKTIAADTTRGSLLVLEDDESVATMMHDVLSHFGYDVAVTQSPEACVTLFHQARLTGRPFDLVVLDLTIRGGTRRGMDTLAALREIDPSVRAVAHSGDPETDVMREPQRFGFAGAIRKPTPLAQLSRLMQELLTGRDHQ